MNLEKEYTMTSLELSALKNTIEQMASDADDRGERDFCIRLTVDDAVALCKLYPTTPCVKPGDTVWFNTYTPDGTYVGICPHKITKIKTSVMAEGDYFDTELSMDLFNKTWFLTKDEAERSVNNGKN